MSLALDIIKNVQGFSKAKYSTWFYYKPDNILFDAGEGVSVSMRNMLYGIDSILLSHSHGDHTGGIPGILSSRASSMGDISKPLSIYYPKKDRYIGRLRQYIEDSIGKLPFALHWRELEAGEILKLNSSNRFIETFPSQHIENSLTLGYKIVEQRTRLSEKYRNLPKEKLMEKIRKDGKESVSEAYNKILLAYTGDTMPINSEHVQEAEVLLHDATFLESGNREENTHATIEEACLAAKNAKVSCLGLFHFSCRYTHHQIKEKIQEITSKLNLGFPVFYIFPPSYPMEFRSL